jgi:hypothetical protein
MKLSARVLGVTILVSFNAIAAGPGDSEPATQAEEYIHVSEHPPWLVYFRHAARTQGRIARQALSSFCQERAVKSKADSSTAVDDSALARICAGAKPIIIVGVNHRDEFNRALFACRPDTDLHYAVYPLYWREVFYDSQWCTRIGFDSDLGQYRVTE